METPLPSLRHEDPAPAGFLWSAGEPPEDPAGGNEDAKRSTSHGDVAFDVLVIEDEPETRDAMLELLAREGYEAEGAADGVEALSLLEGGKRPSLILLDLLMPAMDGWEFCRELAARPALSEIPVAIVSAISQERELPERNRNAGDLRKPVDLQQLLKTIRAYCD